MEREYSIFVVEKNGKYLNDLSKIFKNDPIHLAGFNDPQLALERSVESAPSLIICELELQDSDGVDFCLQIRERKSLDPTLVVLISSKSENYAQIAALNAGADDFLISPINGRLFKSKLMSLLRRVEGTNKFAPKKIGELQIDRDRFLIINNGTEILLPRKEFEILALLGSKPKKVFSREEIKTSIWSLPEEVRNRTIDVHIRKLREKVGGRLIQTVKGVGYKLDA